MTDAGRSTMGRERAASGHPEGGSGRAGIGSTPNGVGASGLRAQRGISGGGTEGLRARDTA